MYRGSFSGWVVCTGPSFFQILPLQRRLALSYVRFLLMNQMLCTMHKGNRTQCFAQTNDALLNLSGFQRSTNKSSIVANDMENCKIVVTYFLVSRVNLDSREVTRQQLGSNSIKTR